jgi:hypothetical protein
MENQSESLSPDDSGGELTGQESLELIARMIRKAKNDYFDTGLSALLWGSAVTFCSLVTFVNYWLHWAALDYVWFLLVAAVVPQVIIAIRESKDRRRKSYEDDLMSGIWISFGIAIFLFSYIVSRYQVVQQAGLYLVIYGIPTFATGYARGFRPMILGGLACWIFAILSTFTPNPYTLLYLAVSAQLAWFIPGLILRKCYLKAKTQHV